MRLLGAALALLGCGERGSDSDALSPCMGLEVDLGEGEFAYTPREDGGPVTMTHGPQNGWHIDLAGEIRGTTGTVSIVPSVVESSQGVSIAGLGQEEFVQVVGWTPSTCSGTFFRLRAFIDDVDPGGPYQRFICTLRDNSLQVSVVVTDLESGETVTAGFNAIAKLDPDDVPICQSY